MRNTIPGRTHVWAGSILQSGSILQRERVQRERRARRHAKEPTLLRCVQHRAVAADGDISLRWNRNLRAVVAGERERELDLKCTASGAFDGACNVDPRVCRHAACKVAGCGSENMGAGS